MSEDLMKKGSINEDTIMKALSVFYPDTEFLSLLLTFVSDESFELSLAKWFKANRNEYDPLDPFNQFYGITQTKPEKLEKAFVLNKDNTDSLFLFIRSELMNNQKHLKDSIKDEFELYTIDKISFVDNKDSNTHNDLPINFYSFALSLKVLMQYYENQFTSFSVGVFDSLFSFNENKEEIFPYDLYCSYLLFIYFYLRSKKFNKTLLMTLLTNPAIYEGFTYHIIEITKAKEQLPSLMHIDAIQMVNQICKTPWVKIVLYVFASKIYETTLAHLIDLFQNQQLNIVSLTIHAPLDILQAFNMSALNIHSISLNALSKGEFTLSPASLSNPSDNPIMNKVSSFSIEGNDIQFTSMPVYLNHLTQFAYITHSMPMPMTMPMDINSLQAMKYLHSLTLKSISNNQFLQLTKLNNLTSLNDIELEIIDDDKFILLNIDDFLNAKHLNTLRQIRLYLRNNTVLLSKENGFYFIKTVQEMLPKCTMFTLTNHTRFDLKSHNENRKCDQCCIQEYEQCQVYQDEYDMITYLNTFALGENEVKSFSNQKKKQLFDMNDYYTLMLCIEKKFTLLRKRPLISLFSRFLCQPVGQLLLVGNFID